ncbi:Crp/Fnr family transcriptional regulator [Desulfolithobacter sp.]
MKPEDLFSFLNPEEAGILLGFLEPVEVKAGEDIFVEGQQAPFMVFIVQGRLVVRKPTEFPGKYQVIAVLETGSFAGEAGIIDDSVHGATVTAVRDSELLSLTRTSFATLASRHPDLAIDLLRYLLAIVHLRLQKTSHRLSMVL